MTSIECLTGTPLLVAEVLSPDSVLRDLNLKKAAYGAVRHSLVLGGRS